MDHIQRMGADHVADKLRSCLAKNPAILDSILLRVDPSERGKSLWATRDGGQHTVLGCLNDKQNQYYSYGCRNEQIEPN